LKLVCVCTLLNTLLYFKFYILSGTTPFGGTTVEREPLLLRTMSISQMKEMEPLLLASVVGGYMLMPHFFKQLYSDVDDDESMKVCLIVKLLFVSL